MSDSALGTLDIARDLEATGMERAQAEAIARAIGHSGERLATKDDLQHLEAATKADFERFGAATKADFERFEGTTKADFDRFEGTMKADFEHFEATTKADIERIEATAATKADLANLRADMYRALWIQGAGIVAIVTALEFLP